MSDETEFGRLLALYGAAVDCRQWETFAEIFTEDVVADYGAVVFEGLAQFKAGAAHAWGEFDSSQHGMLSPTWQVTGDTAKTLTYGTWYIMRNDVEGGAVWEGRGWYDDA